MESPHARVHQLGKEIAESYNNGDTSTVRQKFDELDGYSSQLTTCIDHLIEEIKQT